MTEPSFAVLSNTIIEIHGPGDEAFRWYWSDVRDGLASRAFPTFWATLRARNPNGTVREVVALWSPEELRVLYEGLLWDVTAPEFRRRQRGG